MALDPRFAAELVNFISSPPMLVDTALRALYPEVAQRFGQWAQLVGGRPQTADVYEWLRKEFPGVPERQETDKPDELFREVFKAIVCRYFDIPYNQPSRLILSGDK